MPPPQQQRRPPWPLHLNSAAARAARPTAAARTLTAAISRPLVQAASGSERRLNTATPGTSASLLIPSSPADFRPNVAPNVSPCGGGAGRLAWDGGPGVPAGRAACSLPPTQPPTPGRAPPGCGQALSFRAPSPRAPASAAECPAAAAQTPTSRRAARRAGAAGRRRRRWARGGRAVGTGGSGQLAAGSWQLLGQGRPAGVRCRPVPGTCRTGDAASSIACCRRPAQPRQAGAHLWGTQLQLEQRGGLVAVPLVLLVHRLCPVTQEGCARAGAGAPARAPAGPPPPPPRAPPAGPRAPPPPPPPPPPSVTHHPPSATHPTTPAPGWLVQRVLID